MDGSAKGGFWRRAATPLAPIVRTFRDYRWRDLPPDLLAGLTVSVVDLPQSMAFAIIAGVPPVYGLYTAIFLAFLGALFTSSRFLSVGPTNTQSLLVAATISRLTDDPNVYIQLVIALSLIKGVIQLAFAAARMGQFVRYVSATVMVAFTAGAGILIFAEQVPGFLGMPHAAEPSSLPGVLGTFADVFGHLDQIHPHAAAIGAGSLVALLAMRALVPRLPGPLVVVAVSAAIVASSGWTDVAVVGALPEGLPGFTVPTLDGGIIERLLPGAFALALLGMLESVAIAKSIAQRTGQRIDADQEFFGQGFANLVGSFLQCMPGSGSFSRTALQYAVGARTRVASLACAAFNAVFFLALAPLAYHIPLAALAAILFYVAYRLIDAKSLWRMMRAGRADAAVCVATLGAALLVPLTYAIYVGIILNIAMYLNRASRLHLLELQPVGASNFRERDIRPGECCDEEILLIQIKGDLFFGLADELEDHLEPLAAGSAKVVILRLKHCPSIDATTLAVLDRFVTRMHMRDAHVFMCGVRPAVRKAIRSYGLEARLGEDVIWDAVPHSFGTTRMALARAEELVAASRRQDADGDGDASGEG